MVFWLTSTSSNSTIHVIDAIQMVENTYFEKRITTIDIRY